MNDIVVLIPHYNNPEGLQRALASIDSSEEVDILIVDDGSQEAKIDEDKIDASFTAKGIIKYIYLEHNQGIEAALNAGLDYVQLHNEYNYVGRLDSDDSCIGKRFRIQKDFLNENPNIMLVGSNVIAVSPDGDFLYNIKMPAESKEIRNKMFLNSMFMHPSVMFRRDVIKNIGYYPVNYKAAEDYAYFFRIVKKYETANIQEFLLRYEINPHGISVSKRKQQVANRIKIILDNFYFGFYPIYGLIRNCIIYCTPDRLILFLKKHRG